MKKGFIISSAKWLAFVTVLLASFMAMAQQEVVINIGQLDGWAITPDNIFNYSIQSAKAQTARIKGTIRYRNSNMFLSYSFNYHLRAGLNNIADRNYSPQWSYSSGSLQTLFQTYKTLPEGTWEYCINITLDGSLAESSGKAYDECIYHRQDGIFLINLTEPENEAKIKEPNPVLSWFANYSFTGELTYRLRVAEVKNNQNAVNAVMRNQPMYDERNLVQSSLAYPMYAKPLEKNKWYAWTVDAYYNEILLGGAETWKFMLIDDTVLTALPATRSYVDIRRENGKTQLIFIGGMKLKYTLDRATSDVLTLSLINDRGEKNDIKPTELKAIYGDNRYQINLKDSCNLKHNKDYTLKINTRAGEMYTLPFKYLNPDFTNNKK